jgi:hypothetical protein
VRKLTRQLTAQVKPVPKQISGTTWLPARNLTLQETWGGNPQNLAVGDSITRSIALQADGLTAAQLPALPQPRLQPDNARLYGDQPQLDDQTDDSGMHGKRTESAALIPNAGGALTLPEMRVVWWDLDSDSEKVAVLPAQTLMVNAAKAGVSNPIANRTVPQPAARSELNPVATSTQATASEPVYWRALALILGAFWLLTLWLYWRVRHRQGAAHAAPVATVAKSDHLLEIAQAACRSNDALAAHRAIGAWLQQNAPQTPTLAQWQQSLRQTAGTENLCRALTALDAACFAENALKQEWRGSELAGELARRDRQRASGSTQPDNLPALYPVN